jgi:mRNA interferase MazF
MTSTIFLFTSTRTIEMALRGDVVIVSLPFTDQPTKKRRPALVVPADVCNRLIAKTVIMMVTRNLARKNDPAHLFVGPATPDGASSGLRMQSLVSCNNIFTVDHEDLISTLGHLSDPLMWHRNDCLKAAFELP